MTEQKRIILWSVPRSISTAVLRAMMSRDSCRGYLEPWVLTYYMSADSLSDRFSKELFPNREGTTFKERKEMLEGEHEGFNEVFVKGMVYRLGFHLEAGTLEDVLPQGYQHTFIMRNPAKAIPSLYNGTSKGLSGFVGFRPEEVSYKEMVQMHDYVTGKLGQKSVVIDADELQKDPESVMRRYCEAVGIEFQTSMLKWRPLNVEQYKEFEEFVPWYELAINSHGFLPKTPSTLPDVKDLPQEVQKAIADNMPHYQMLYEKRIKL